jgi:hypothetical protein
MILIQPGQLGLVQGNQAAVKAAGIGTPGSQQCRRGEHDRPHLKLGQHILRCTFWHPLAMSGRCPGIEFPYLPLARQKTWLTHLPGALHGLQRVRDD